MSKKIPLPTARLIYQGVFDWDNLYKTLRNWLNDRDYEISERMYKHKVPSPAGAEDEVKWEGMRKVSGMVKFRLNVYFHLYDMKEVDVIKEGAKTRMTKARIMGEFTGSVEVDYSNKWFGKSKFMDIVSQWFFDWVWRKNWDNIYSDELYYTMYKFYSAAKETLDMDAQYFRSRMRV